MRFRPNYGSHLPVLVELVRRTTGDVLEMGGGWVSTPILHWLCLAQRRKLVTLENDEGMCRMLKNYQDLYHEIRLVADWDAEPIERGWDLAFIDHAPAMRRKEDIRRLANFAKYIAVHDTSWKVEKNYHYSEIWPLFRYRYDYRKVKPYTTVLSNFVDLSGMEI